MKPSLLAQPYAHAFSDILTKFEDGRPLSSDQLNFLLRHEKTLSSHALDPVIKYYLARHKEHPDQALSFHMPTQNLNKVCVYQIKNTVQQLLANQLSHVDLKMTMEQFLQLKRLGMSEIVFWHGYQFLTHSVDYCPGAVPLMVYFQWGRLFGVVKLSMANMSDSLEGNVLIYFEDMDQRDLLKCVMDYTQAHKLELQPQPTLAVPHIEEKLIQESLYSTPTLRPAGFEIIDPDKR